MSYRSMGALVVVFFVLVWVCFVCMVVVVLLCVLLFCCCFVSFLKRAVITLLSAKSAFCDVS